MKFLPTVLALALLFHPTRPVWLVHVPGGATYNVMFDWRQPTNLSVLKCTTVVSSSAASGVQTAVDNATAGAVVCVSAGTATWTTPLAISGKAITVIGAGIGASVITLNYGLNYDPPIFLTTTTANTARLAGFTFIRGSSMAAYYWVNLQAASSASWFAADNFRIDHNRFVDNAGMISGERVINITHMFGVIDHNVLDITTTCSCQLINANGTADNDNGGWTAWAQLTLLPGSKYAVFVEDNQFNRTHSVSESLVEGYGGSRVVFRFNTVVNGHTGEHGLDSGGRRGAISQEEFGNAFTQTDHSTDAGTARGGVSYYFNNTYGGSAGYSGFTLFYPRAVANYLNDGTGGKPSEEGFRDWKQCDGTQWDVVSNSLSDIGSRQVIAYGSGYRGTIANPDVVPFVGGAPTGSQRGLDGPGTHGYPCRDGLGVAPNQTFSPMYEWNNGSGRTWVENQFTCITPPYQNALCAAGFRLNHWVAADRDYYIGASGVNTSCSTGSTCTPFNGTTGVGWGPLSLRPTTCTTGPNTGQGVGYWATDQGSWNTSSSNPYGVQQNGADGVLYRCTATNTWAVHYTPYTYPHPLQTS